MIRCLEIILFQPKVQHGKVTLLDRLMYDMSQCGSLIWSPDLSNTINVYFPFPESLFYVFLGPLFALNLYWELRLASEAVRFRRKNSNENYSPFQGINHFCAVDNIYIPTNQIPQGKQMSCHETTHLARRPHRIPQTSKKTKTAGQQLVLSYQGPRSAIRKMSHTVKLKIYSDPPNGQRVINLQASSEREFRQNKPKK
ncbi:hypothetical protein AVEN_103845-1 [Araneus ventricosus]|uniref:Uncharacterized protein n=1 Tax=Araneus ventricosus TaxID=182803 RepID=A0A4Y2V7Y7_ARAVE|nr:hypothetical protein AVEN_103845-1 [Araneus ventricosus]